MFFGRTIALCHDADIDCLIQWVQLAPAVDHSPTLNRPCLHPWTKLIYGRSFQPFRVFPLYFVMSRICSFLWCPNRPGVAVIWEWPSYFPICFQSQPWSDIFFYWLSLQQTIHRHMWKKTKNLKGNEKKGQHTQLRMQSPFTQSHCAKWWNCPAPSQWWP